MCIDPVPDGRPIELIIGKNSKTGGKRGPKDSNEAAKFKKWLATNVEAKRKDAVEKGVEFGVKRAMAYRIIKEVNNNRGV